MILNMLQAFGRSMRYRILKMAPVHCALCWGLFGLTACATTPPPKPTSTLTQVRIQLPQITALPETDESQSKGGIEISVAPVPYEVVWDTVVSREPASTTFQQRLSTIGDTEVSLETHDYVRETIRPQPEVSPDQMEFVVTVNNQMDRVFRGAGTVVQFNVNGQLAGIDQNAYRGLLNMIVPPRSERQVRIHGPQTSALPDNATLGVFLYDVVTAKDDAGNITGRENFEWYYNVSTRPFVDSVNVVTRERWVPNQRQ